MCKNFLKSTFLLGKNCYTEKNMNRYPLLNRQEMGCGLETDDASSGLSAAGGGFADRLRRGRRNRGGLTRGVFCRRGFLRRGGQRRHLHRGGAGRPGGRARSSHGAD